MRRISAGTVTLPRLVILDSFCIRNSEFVTFLFIFDIPKVSSRKNGRCNGPGPQGLKAGGPHQRRKCNAGFSLNVDWINPWVRHFSRFSRPRTPPLLEPGHPTKEVLIKSPGSSVYPCVPCG